MNDHADAYVAGEVCRHCDEAATHKIEEVTEDPRHPFSQYVCCEWFGMIMGRVAKRWCEENA